MYLNLSVNELTSIDFLNQLPNPEKLEELIIANNKIEPTDISVFSKFVNLKTLKIGTMRTSLEKGKHNKFYGSLKAYQPLTKLETICIEATDVDSGLEYLPFSLVQGTREVAKIYYGTWGGYSKIECSPYDTNAKCFAIQNELRPYNYDLFAWQLAHPEKMLTVWKEKYADKTQLVSELKTTKVQESEKTAKISRLETKLQRLEEAKTRLEQELTQERQSHDATKQNHNHQLRELATIIFPSSADISHLSFADLKNQAEKVKAETNWKTQIKHIAIGSLLVLGGQKTYHYYQGESSLSQPTLN